MRTTKILLGLLVMIFLSAGCASLTIKPQIDKPEFQAKNLPIRTYRIAVVSDDSSRDKESIEKFVARNSDLMQKQIGSQLRITHWVPIKYERNYYRSALNQIAETVYPIRNEYDLAIGFTRFTLFNVMVMFLGFPVPQAAIDDSFRRFIIIRNFNDSDFQHDIYHSLIFDHLHSASGVMSAVGIQLLPFIPPLNKTPYLSPLDWEEVQKNKWRDFSKKPQLKEEDIMDELSPDVMLLYLPEAGGEEIMVNNIEAVYYYYSLAGLLMIDTTKNSVKISLEGKEIWQGPEAKKIHIFPWGETYVDGKRARP